jgi:hypothetical protein
VNVTTVQPYSVGIKKAEWHCIRQTDRKPLIQRQGRMLPKQTLRDVEKQTVVEGVKRGDPSTRLFESSERTVPERRNQRIDSDVSSIAAGERRLVDRRRRVARERGRQDELRRCRELIPKL